MNQTVVSIVVGLLAGVGGALAVQWMRAETPAEGGAGPMASPDLGDMPRRLERIEALLRQETLRAGPTLRTSAAGTSAAPAAEDQIEALVAALEERLKPTIEESVQTSIEKAIAEGGLALDGKQGQEKAKKRVSLAELSAELELSSGEEEDLRRISQELSEGFLKLLVEENGSLDDLREEFNGAKDDPGKQAALGIKYMGKIMGNIVPFITLGLTRDEKLAQAIGRERADRLDREFEVSDLDPFGLEAIFTDD